MTESICIKHAQHHTVRFLFAFRYLLQKCGERSLGIALFGIGWPTICCDSTSRANMYCTEDLGYPCQIDSHHSLQISLPCEWRSKWSETLDFFIGPGSHLCFDFIRHHFNVCYYNESHSTLMSWWQNIWIFAVRRALQFGLLILSWWLSHRSLTSHARYHP